MNYNWLQFRQQMPVTQRWSYLDHAAVAPLPAPTCAAIRRWLDQAAEHGDTVWPQWNRRLEDARSLMAGTLGTSHRRIAFVPNTTHGLAILAEGFRWQAGDNVVTMANEFPSNLYPWMNLADRGVEVRRVPTEAGRVDLSRVADRCDERTRIVTTSWIGYASGFRIDPAEMATLAHDHGAYFCLDAIQGLGVFPLDIGQAGVDFLSADGHKWMLGPEGAGICYCSSDLMSRLRPIGVGWNSVVDRYNFAEVGYRLREEAARYEGGSANMIGNHGLAASLELLVSFGLSPDKSPVAERILEVTDMACRELQAAGATVLNDRSIEHASGIVTFTLPAVENESTTYDAVRRRAAEAGIALGCRGGGLRISPHAYNDESDVGRLIEVVREYGLGG